MVYVSHCVAALTFVVHLLFTSGRKNRCRPLPRSSCFSENLVRTAFKCFQLVTTDFLPTMPCSCLQSVVDVAAKFGLQHQELNVSLTAVGLLVSASCRTAGEG